MIAENKIRESHNETLAYNDKHFWDIAEKMRGLEEKKMGNNSAEINKPYFIMDKSTDALLTKKDGSILCFETLLEAENFKYTNMQWKIAYCYLCTPYPLHGGEAVICQKCAQEGRE